MLRRLQRSSAVVRCRAAAAAAPLVVSATTTTATRFCSTTATSTATGIVPSAGDAVDADSPQRVGKWSDDPELDDIDYSIPQVNCAFIADLIAKRKAEQRKQWGEVKLKKQQEEGGAAATKTTSTADTKKDDEAAAGAAADEDDEEGMAQLDVALHPTDGILLLDLRTVAEIAAWGTIEGAKVLPMHEFYDTMHLDADAFYEHVGFEKPAHETTILMFCQHGPRSLMAAQLAYYLGYKNVIHLRDGYHMWARQFYMLCRRWMVDDLETGIDNRRLAEFEASKAIAADIAPEFNEIAEAETDLIRIDHGRSMGTIALEMPPKVLQLSQEFEAQRDQIEARAETKRKQLLDSGFVEEQQRQLEPGVAEENARQEAAAAKEEAAAAAATGDDKKLTVRRSGDPVLSATAQDEDELDAEAALLRVDYTSEAAKFLRRKRASERTGVPFEYQFKRKEQPHGTGR